MFCGPQPVLSSQKLYYIEIIREYFGLNPSTGMLKAPWFNLNRTWMFCKIVNASLIVLSLDPHQKLCRMLIKQVPLQFFLSDRNIRSINWWYIFSYFRIQSRKNHDLEKKKKTISIISLLSSSSSGLPVLLIPSKELRVLETLVK